MPNSSADFRILKSMLDQRTYFILISLIRISIRIKVQGEVGIRNQYVY